MDERLKGTWQTTEEGEDLLPLAGFLSVVSSEIFLNSSLFSLVIGIIQSHLRRQSQRKCITYYVACIMDQYEK